MEKVTELEYSKDDIDISQVITVKSSADSRTDVNNRLNGMRQDNCANICDKKRSLSTMLIEGRTKPVDDRKSNSG